MSKTRRQTLKIIGGMVLAGLASPASMAAEEICSEQMVIMLATSWCGYCRQARAYFNANQIAFTEVDIEKTEDDRFRALGRQTGVPLIFIGKETVRGFQPHRLNELLCLDDQN